VELDAFCRSILAVKLTTQSAAAAAAAKFQVSYIIQLKIYRLERLVELSLNGVSTHKKAISCL